MGAVDGHCWLDGRLVLINAPAPSLAMRALQRQIIRSDRSCRPSCLCRYSGAREVLDALHWDVAPEPDEVEQAGGAVQLHAVAGPDGVQEPLEVPAQGVVRGEELPHAVSRGWRAVAAASAWQLRAEAPVGVQRVHGALHGSVR